MCLPAARPRFPDLLGITLSLTCLLHCLALPTLILLAPALSRWIAMPEWVHAAILTLALPAAILAMKDGWRRHRRAAPAVLAGAGLGLLAGGLAAHERWIALADPEAADRWLTLAGATMLATAHLLNWRWRHTGRPHPRS